MNANQKDRRFVILLSTLALLLVSFACHGAESDYYTEEQVYRSRPEPNRETPFGHIGVTGVMARIYPGVTVKVEQTMPGSPAAGGGYLGLWLDEEPDAEYTFYALLALGHLS